MLRKKEEFNSLFKGAKKKDTPYFRLYWNKKSGRKGRFAFAASKKVGNAVVRNKCKRRLYEIIRKNQFKDSEDYDMIFFVNRRSFYREFEEVEKAVLTVIKQIN